jgi:hypothetical protein
MRIMKTIKTVMAASLLLSTVSVQAGLVSTDWKTSGDGLSTLHEETGIEWLDLTQTLHMSINEVDGLLGSTYLGWRFATKVEVADLLKEVFPDGASYVDTSGSYRFGQGAHVSAQTLISFLGRTATGHNGPYSMGLFKADSETGEPEVLYSGMTKSGLSNGYLKTNVFLSASYDVSHNYSGVYLVSDGGLTLSSQSDPTINANNASAPVNDVSQPALFGLMGLGLCAFLSRRRKS